MNPVLSWLPASLAVCLSPLVSAQQLSLEELEQRCQQAREAKIAPLRAQAVEDCISAPRSNRTREDCERRNRDFGQGGGTVHGAARLPMFMDLPECQDYLRARDGQPSGSSRR